MLSTSSSCLPPLQPTFPAREANPYPINSLAGILSNASGVGGLHDVQGLRLEAFREQDDSQPRSIADILRQALLIGESIEECTSEDRPVDGNSRARSGQDESRILPRRQ